MKVKCKINLICIAHLIRIIQDLHKFGKAKYECSAGSRGGTRYSPVEGAQRTRMRRRRAQNHECSAVTLLQVYIRELPRTSGPQDQGVLEWTEPQRPGPYIIAFLEKAGPTESQINVLFYFENHKAPMWPVVCNTLPSCHFRF